MVWVQAKLAHPPSLSFAPFSLSVDGPFPPCVVAPFWPSHIPSRQKCDVVIKSN
ncbi:hypothetical protein RSAG8_04483, partial [Rhizoctonia solani AG-8 WAC10335]